MALPDDAPSLTLRDPESTRSALVSGSISTLLHVAIIASLAALAWMAPEMSVVIPVKVIQELPGSNDAAPAPRKLIQRREVASLTPAALQQTVQPTAVNKAQVSNESLQMSQVEPNVAPTEIARRQVDSARVTAVTTTNTPTASAVDLSQIQAVTVQPSDFRVPVANVAGPRQVAEGTVAAAGAPQVVKVFAEVGKVDYNAQASAGEYTDGPINDIVIDTGVSDDFKGGTGGTGTVENVVRCDESSFVQDYYNLMMNRTRARWTVPEGTPLDAKVVLHFELDASGTATKIRFDGRANPELGASAVAALRSASPFPPMNDNNRCLAGKALTGTFTVPSS